MYYKMSIVLLPLAKIHQGTEFLVFSPLRLENEAIFLYELRPPNKDKSSVVK